MITLTSPELWKLRDEYAKKTGLIASLVSRGIKAELDEREGVSIEEKQEEISHLEEKLESRELEVYDKQDDIEALEKENKRLEDKAEELESKLAQK